MINYNFLVKRAYWIIILFLLPALSSFAITNDNPIVKNYNDRIDFNNLTEKKIQESISFAKEYTTTHLSRINSLRPEELSFDNTLLVLDDIYNNLFNLSQIFELVVCTHTNPVIRDQATKAMQEFTTISEDLSLNKDLYKAVKAFSITKSGTSLTRERAQFLKNILKGFSRNGFDLPQQLQDSLKKVNLKISELSLEFSKNIATDNPFLFFNEAEMNGLPEDFKKERKQADGTFKVDVSKPSFEPFMNYATSSTARKKLFMIKMNKAADLNSRVLDQLVRNRQTKAKLLGYPSFAAFEAAENMAQNPEVVWKFLGDLAIAVKPKAMEDKAALLAEKSKETGKTESKIFPYETSYYGNKILEEKYKVDALMIKEFFEINNVINGIFGVYQKIYQLKFEEDLKPNTWHSDVKAFHVFDKAGNRIGYFYLDLYPREDKYGHAACFNIINARAGSKMGQLPTAALVCNFPKPTESTPSLLVHRNVITFFHEFGHLMHVLVSNTELASTSGIMVAGDFVEAPSQIMENWAWNKEVLSLFALHYKTGEVIPGELIDKMIRARNFNSGIDALQQIFYGTLDFTLHDKYPQKINKPIPEITKELHSITPLEFVEDTYFEAGFGHLNGYGAKYYGYMWSLVYAEDMFSVFEKKGLLNEETGLNFRNNLLAKGGSTEALELVKNFIGREPNNTAFLKHLGVK